MAARTNALIGEATIVLAPEDLSTGREFTERQAKLVEDLEAVILADGFADLTVADLADRLRCSRRTLYEVAESKDELVLLVIDRLLRRVARRGHEAMRRHTDPVERLRAYLVSVVAEVRNLTVTFSEDVARHAGARRLFNSHYRAGTETVRRLVEEGIAAGAFRDVHPQLVAEIFDAGLERISEPQVLRTSGATFAEAMDELMSVVLNGLLGASSAATARKKSR